MGKLSHITQQMAKPQPVAIEGMLEAIAQNVAKTVADAMSADMTRSMQGLNAVQGRVDQVAPAIEAALTPTLTQAFKGLESRLVRLGKELEKRAITQQDMVKLQADLVRALSNVQIPDYSEQIESLRQPPVDLAPVLKKLDSIEIPETEERPLSWTFDIKRNQSGLITKVVAEAN